MSAARPLRGSRRLLQSVAPVCVTEPAVALVGGELLQYDRVSHNLSVVRDERDYCAGVEEACDKQENPNQHEHHLAFVCGSTDPYPYACSDAED